jgi:hypothetical protein
MVSTALEPVSNASIGCLRLLAGGMPSPEIGVDRGCGSSSEPGRAMAATIGLSIPAQHPPQPQQSTAGAARETGGKQMGAWWARIVDGP